MSASGTEWHIGGADGAFPILDHEWRILGDIDGDGYDYLEIEDAPFSIDAVRHVAKASTNLAEKYEDVRLEAMHLQEIHTGNVAHQTKCQIFPGSAN